MRRYSSHLRFVTALVLLSAALSLYSPLRAQETPPPPPPLPDVPVEVTAPSEPTATTEPLPSETPTLEPTLTDVPPTETLEPTAAPPTETPFVEPTLEPTAEATLDASATPEGEVTSEATVEVTPDFITATPELLATEEALHTGGAVTRTARTQHVEDNLLAVVQLVESGQASVVAAAGEADMLNLDASGQLVHIELVAHDAAEANRLRPILEGMGGVFLIGYDRRMEFDFPITSLAMLNGIQGDFVVIQPQEGRPTLGPRTSEGVQVTGAAQWHARGIDGAGVRVGVIDQGFTGYPSAETTNCGKAISNFTVQSLTFFGDHGTNVTEIICDMAPKAEVYIAQVSTLSSVNAAVDWLISQNVNVINMSMRWDMHGAGDGTGEMNTIIQRAINAGILWVNAAGNSNGDTYQGAFAPIVAPPEIPVGFGYGDDDEFHDFDAGAGVKVINPLFSGQTLDCNFGDGLYVDAILRWNDWNTSRTGNATGDDYDMFLMQSTDGGINWTQAVNYFTFFGVESSFIQGAFDSLAPMEEFYEPVWCDQPMKFGILIERFIDQGVNYLDLITWGSGHLQIASQSTSISTPADSRDVLTVAAGEIKPHPDGWPFSLLGYPDLAVYSSRGPVLGDGGTDPGSVIPLWDKPDITAPTNVTTSRDTAFNGTSAASPHAAGFAALVYQYNRTFYETFAGAARPQEVKNDILDATLFLRSIPPNSSTYAFCNAEPINCFGQGAITINNEFFIETDALLQHTDGRVLRSGTGWTQQTQTGASGGNYIYTKGQNANTDNFAQIQFGVAHATGVQVFYWRRPDLNGDLEVRLNGSVVPVSSGTTALNAGTPTLASFTLSGLPYIGLSEITIRPNGAANGLSMDYVQVLHDPGIIPTLQENQLSTFGTWPRVALANTSGGYHMTNNQRGAGVQFYTNAPEFAVTYTRRPDGGLMEIRVNGQLCLVCGEINTWSGGAMTGLQAVHYVNAAALTPTFGAPPYHVQLINSGRQLGGTTNRPYVTIDNVRFPAGGGLVTLPAVQIVEAEVGYNGQAGSSFLPMNGVWTNLAQASAFGGRIYNTTTAGAEFRFRTNSVTNIVYYTGLSTGALVEIYVNGQLCTACGTIDMYRASTMYKIPHFINIPGTFTAPYHVTLRNTGRRSSGSATVATATMGIDRIESLNASFMSLNLFNVQGNDNGSFWINERWVANRQIDAIGTDVYINNSPYGGIFALTCSRDFTLLLGKNPNGGTVRVQLWDDRDANEDNWHYITLAEFNGQASSTMWRSGLNVSIPTTTFPPTCLYTNGIGQTLRPFRILVEVDSNTQFGNTLDYGYVDALLVNDNEDMYGWGAAPIETLNFEDADLVEIGPGWTNFAQGGAIGGNVGRTNQTSGASIQFTILEDSDPDPDENPRPRLLFSRAPDGGIAEVFVNGLFQYEVSFYSPVILPQQFLPLALPANIKYPAVVELRNVPRRTTGSTGYYIYVDAVIETNEPDGFATPIIGTGTQNDSTNIQRFGATWTRSTNPPTTTVFPSGIPANIDTTTQNSGGLRFRLTGSNRFIFVSSASANRGIAEIWVNGRLCTACGTINTFRPQTFWRVPFQVEIPLSFDADPAPGVNNQRYFVEIRTTNMRSTGATGFGLSVDELIVLDTGGSAEQIDWNAAYATSVGSPAGGTWSEVFSANALNGSYFRTAVASAVSTSPFDDVNGDGYKDNQTQTFEYLTPNFAQKDIVLLRNMTPNGGVAEIWISDFDASLLPGNPYVFRLCFECGTINNYSPYTRYQVPYFFTIPDRFDGDTPNGRRYIRILNTGGRAAGSSGYYMEIDGFMFP